MIIHSICVGGEGKRHLNGISSISHIGSPGINQLLRSQIFQSYAQRST